MLQKNNIIIGAGRLYIAEVDTELPAFNTTGGSVKNDFEADPNWDDMGFTSDGVEVAYEPTYTDVDVDQYRDAAKVFLESETMNFGTTLQEATLEHLAVAWGRLGGDIVVDGATRTFTVGQGPDAACEYSLAIVGPGPGTEAVCDPDGNPIVVERVYHPFRVVSVEGSTHSLNKTGATMFPVTFRALPHEVTRDGSTKSLYADILDYNVTEAETP